MGNLLHALPEIGGPVSVILGRNGGKIKDGRSGVAFLDLLSLLGAG